MTTNHLSDGEGSWPASRSSLVGESARLRQGYGGQPSPASTSEGWWRTLDERAGDPAFRDRLVNEFPSQIEAIADPVARRTFLKLMGASLALAGVTACTRQPAEKIVPYVRQPEDLVPGKPLYYATAMPLGGTAIGLLVESHEGRPTKIEGNPLHPGSLGATDVFAQAAVLGLYDPDRSKTLTNLGEIRPWSALLGAIRAALVDQQPRQGAGLRILTESISSPTLAAQIRELLARFPAARWHQWDPASGESARAGAKLAFGEYLDCQYRLDQADVIVSLDSDFLASRPLRYARDFSTRKRPEQGARMNRLYAFESMPTSTGSRADHRLPLRPSQIESVAWSLTAAVGVRIAQPAGTAPVVSGTSLDVVQKWVAAISKDLLAHRGASLVVAGEGQPPAVHALAHAMNEALGNVGRTVVYTDPVEGEPVDQIKSLTDLVTDLNAGRVDLLVIVGGNPVYTAPVNFRFGQALDKTPLRVHLSLYDDETSERCQWHVPEAHFLEAWSDARGYDGTATIIQPLIAPLYGGKSTHELLAAMSARPERSGYDIVREFWANQGVARGFQPRDRRPERPAPQEPRVPVSATSGQPESRTGITPEFEQEWRRWLHDGVVPNTARSPKPVRATTNQLTPPPTMTSGNLEIVFKNDPTILDGRFANNGWLQELPKPITKLTWDNAVLVSPATANQLGFSNAPSFQGGEHGQIISRIVELRHGGRSVRGAVFQVAGHPDNCVTVHLGYGRTRAGSLGNGPGFNANAIRTSNAMWFAGGLEIVDTGSTYSLACTQYHHLMEGRGMVRAVTRDDYMRDPKSVHAGQETIPRTI